jgi:hypothetical protein
MMGHEPFQARTHSVMPESGGVDHQGRLQALTKTERTNVAVAAHED